MSNFTGSLRALVAGLLAVTLTLGCQAVFGDFKINDKDFGAAGGLTGGGDTGASGASGTGNGNGNGNGGSGGSSAVQTGPIIVMPVDGLFTTELGGQATFTIVLNAAPKADVTIALKSSNTNEGIPSPISVVFTKDDWNAPQVITVTGVDDTLPDGNQKYQILTDPADSTDPSFKGKQAVPVNLINIDNETAGITVTPTMGLVTSESGMQDTFTVVLNSKPTADVTIGLSSDNPGEGTVSPTILVFTPDDWMAPQVVTVTGVDDTKIDPNTVYHIVTAAPVSDDKAYNGDQVNPPDVTVVNLDNDSAGVNVILVSGIDPTDKTKLRTSESGGTATFTVQLNAPPTADVTIAISSDSPDEGTVTPTSLTFTALNWMAPQLVTVTGVDDNVADGDQPFNIMLDAPKTDDKSYAAVGSEKVEATNVDNDKAGFTVMLATGIDTTNPMQLMTDEGGGTATFTVALNSKPSDTVTVNLSSSLPTEGTVNPLSLVFTTDNWNAPQVVTVKGVDDKVADGNQPYFIRTSAAISNDKGYSGLDPQDIAVTNRDNDTAGVVVTLASGIDPNNMKQLVTSEGGDSATFTVALTSQPTADVTIVLVSNNTKEGTVSPASIKFTNLNYNAPQTITVTGVDDKVADGNQTYTIAVGAPSSKDLSYNPPKGPVGQTVTLTNRDNDSAGVIVNPTSGLVTDENGQTATFTIRLQSQPTADVSFAIASNNTKEGTVNTASAKFTALNWNAPQTITVTGVQDDGTADGPQVFKVTIAAAVSTDPGYGGSSTKPAIKPSDVSVTNLDDDTPGILVSPTMGLVTTEGGGTATFTVDLQSRPTQPVKITFQSSKPTEGSVSPVSVNFTSANYNALQTVTITGVNDPQPIQDGPQVYKITGLSSSTDPKYNALVTLEVNATNLDNDSAGIQISPMFTAMAPGLTSEAGGTATFSVVLNSVPANPVSFTLTSLNPAEGAVAPGTLNFTAANWNAAQVVTVTGVDDKVADGNVQYKVRLSGATSLDMNYSGKFGIDLPFSNADNDQAGYVVNAATNPLITSESGTTATFTVALQSQPTAAVTIALSSSNTGEGTVLPTSLSFSPALWNVPQTVTITGVDDSPKVADGTQAYSILLANAVSGDSSYNAKFTQTVAVNNLDNDTPGFIVTGASGLHTSENPAASPATFTVSLATQPVGLAIVTLPISSSNTKEGTVSPSPLVFSASNGFSQVVTVTGVDDQKEDGNQSYTIQFGSPTSADPGYQTKALPPSPVTMINDDNDIIGVLVTPQTCSTTPGTTATFSVVLNTQPGADVTIGLSSDTPTEGMVMSPISPLVFTMDNWNVAQVVTVIGIDDMTMMSAMTQYEIVTTNASSPGDTSPFTYDGAVVADVTCTNTTTAPTPPPMP